MTGRRAMLARIYRPSKTAMQSGRAKTDRWMLEFEAESARRIDPLMGWTSSDDTAAGQLRLSFDSEEAAVAYAKSRNIPYQIVAPRERRPQMKAYADNFSFRRRKPWTH
ncbi:MAG: ETC complex I subunit [Parvularculaceae bacterium]